MVFVCRLCWGFPGEHILGRMRFFGTFFWAEMSFQILPANTLWEEEDAIMCFSTIKWPVEPCHSQPAAGTRLSSLLSPSPLLLFLFQFLLLFLLWLLLVGRCFALATVLSFFLAVLSLIWSPIKAFSKQRPVHM